MFTWSAKPVRMIGDPDKWSSTVMQSKEIFDSEITVDFVVDSRLTSCPIECLKSIHSVRISSKI
jgi:hypothetical protein